MTKQTLRRQILRRLNQQPERARQRKSLVIARALRRLPAYKKAGTVLCYAAIPGEVETRSILEKALADGKRVAVPVTLTASKRLIAAEISHVGRDLVAFGPFQIPEPHKKKIRRLPVSAIDLILVPGIAFDRRGGRLGRGGGYFDRFLSRVQSRVRRVGLAFQFQVTEALPLEAHDQRVSFIVTEKEVIATRVKKR